jgi:signal peptidase II
LLKIGFKRDILPFLIICVLIAIDQITKKLADIHLQTADIIRVAGDFIILVYAKNRGAFLSWGHQLPHSAWAILFIAIPILLLFLITVHVIRQHWNNKLYRTSLILGLSGGIGNIIDRIAYGSVTDFMNIGIGPYLRSGIFNVADLYIVTLVFYLLISQLISKKGQTLPDKTT